MAVDQLKSCNNCGRSVEGTWEALDVSMPTQIVTSCCMACRVGYFQQNYFPDNPNPEQLFWSNGFLPDPTQWQRSLTNWGDPTYPLMFVPPIPGNWPPGP